MSANWRSVAYLVFATALALLCAACMVGPDFSSPSAPVADRWLESRDPSVKSVPLISSANREDWAWWTVFHDPVLNRLIEIAYDQNLALVDAGTRVLEARAQLGVAIGEFYPQVQQGRGGITYNPAEPFRPLIGPPSAFLHNFWRDSLGLTVNWELDFWGKFRRGH